MRFMQSGAVLTQVFALYGRIFSSMGSLATGQLEHIASSVVTAMQVKIPGYVSSLRCARTISENLDNERATPHYFTYLTALLQNVVSIVEQSLRGAYAAAAAAAVGAEAGAGLRALPALHAEAAAATSATAVPSNCFLLALGEDYNVVVEAFATFVHSYSVFHPQVLVASDSLDGILLVYTLSLRCCGEKEALRDVLLSVQMFFAPFQCPRATEETKVR